MYQTPTSVPVDPIISRLRPRTVAEVLDQAFRLYRKHFLTFVAIIAVVHVPLQLMIQSATAFLLGDLAGIQDEIISGGTSRGRTNQITSYFIVLYSAILGLSLLYGLLQKLSEGALTVAVADSHLDRPVTFGNSYRQMLRQIGPLLGLIVLQILIALAVFVPIILVLLVALGLGLGGNSTAGAGGALVCVACVLILPAIAALAYVSIRLTVTTPALIVEKLGPMEAIRRSWGLVSNYWWRTLALVAVLWVLQLVVLQGPASLVSGIVAIFAPRNFVLQQLISGVVTTLTTLVYLPLQLISITLYYFDLRVRKEGFDLETAMSQRYSPAMPAPGWGGSYGTSYGYGQPQYGQTQPVGDYVPPQLGVESQGQPYGYGSNRSDYEQPYTPEYSGEPTLPTAPEMPVAPETPRSSDTQ